MTNFEEHFNFLSANGAKPALEGLRNSAFESFKIQGFPTRKNEEWKYTNVKSIEKIDFEIAKTAAENSNIDLSEHRDESDINVIFVDGILVDFESAKSSADSSSAGLCLEQLTTSIESSKDAVALINKGLLIEENGFTALNRALIDQGISIKVAKNQCIEKTIHLIYLNTDKNENGASFPRVLIQLAENAELTICETHIGENGTYLKNSVVDISLKDGARLCHYKSQVESEKAFHISHTNISQDRNSNYEAFSFDIGSKIARNTVNAVLNGEGTETWLNGVYLTRDKQHIDNHIAIDHKSANCVSHQFYKGLLDDHSRAVFNGKIFVRKDAQKTAAFQTNKNLLLSNSAEIDTKPQLEIDADDVKCSHGAAIGQLNQDEIFYLKTRGIPEETARKMLCQAFVEESIMKISSKAVRSKLQKQLVKTLEREPKCQTN